MGTFDNGPSPRRGRQEPSSRSQARLAPAEGTILNRGSLPPGIVGQDQVPTRAIGLDQLHLGPADYATDPTKRSYNVPADDLTGLKWVAVGNLYQLQAYLGPVGQPLHISVWGGYSWKNDSANAGHTRSIIGLYKSGTDTYPTIWADNVCYRWLQNDNHFYRFDLFARFILPADDGDWRIGMLHQYNADGSHGSQTIRDVSIMTLISAYDPNAILGGSEDLPASASE